MKMESKLLSWERHFPKDTPPLLESPHCLSSPINRPCRIGLSIDLSKSILNPSHGLWGWCHSRGSRSIPRHTYSALLPRWRYYVGRCSLCPEAHSWKWSPPLDQCQSSCPSHSSSQWNTWKKTIVDEHQLKIREINPWSSLWAHIYDFGVIWVAVALITHFEWSFPENVLRMACAFQSGNGACVLQPCWADTFPGCKWILGTVGIVSISCRPMNNTGIRQKNGVWGTEDMSCPRRICGLADFLAQARWETKLGASDGAAQCAMPFDLNKFIILRGKKNCCLASAHFPWRGSEAGGGRG